MRQQRYYERRAFRPEDAVYGAVAWYPFPETAPYGSEMCKQRRVVVLGRSPRKSVETGNSLQVIPLSKKLDDCDSVVKITFGGNSFAAILDSVTTINPFNLRDFDGCLSPSELRKIEAGVASHILPSMEPPRNVTIGPGAMIRLPWNSGDRTVVIIGNMEKEASRVYVLPITLMGDLVRPQMKIRALAKARLKEGVPVGKLNAGDLRTLRYRLLGDLGFQVPEASSGFAALPRAGGPDPAALRTA